MFFVWWSVYGTALSFFFLSSSPVRQLCRSFVVVAVIVFFFMVLAEDAHLRGLISGGFVFYVPCTCIDRYGGPLVLVTPIFMRTRVNNRPRPSTTNTSDQG